MRWLLAIAILLTSLPASAWYSDTNFQYRQKITVDNTKVGADLTDFPVYLDTDDLAAGFYTHAKSNCADVRITKSDGSTEVPREIVFCSGSNGEIHFKAAGTLSGSVDTDFYIYYGNSGASDYATSATYGAENVWNSNYVAVWHFQESPAGSAPQMLDSTANNNDGTSYGTMIGADSVAGKLAGNSLDFDGSNDAIGVTDTAALRLPGSYTYSSWIKTSTTAVTSMFGNLGSGAPSAGWNANIRGDTNKIQALAYNSGLYLNIESTTDPTDGGWHLFHITQDGTTRADLYMNGTSEANDTTSLSLVGDYANNITIGGREESTVNAFAGTMDEVRIMSSAMASTWISTEYNNQNSSSTFYTASAEETVPASSSGILFLWNLI